MIENEVNGHAHFSGLKMCFPIFDLLPLILNSGTVDGEMWSYVALMPVVMKFGPTH